MFKNKNKKQVVKERRTTIDALHKEKIHYFENLQKKILPQKQREITKLKKKIDEIDNNIKNNLHNNDNYYKYSEIKKYNFTIDKLNEDIIKIQKKDEEEYYFLRVNSILLKYYDMKNVNSQFKYNMSDLLYEYAHIMDGSYSSGRVNEILNLKCHKNNIEYCTMCNITLIRNDEQFLVCSKCGNAIQDNIDVNPSYKERQEYEHNQPYRYLKINHLDECLAQFQGKENTDIPNDVLIELQEEIKKNRTDTKKLTYDIIYEYLKKINRTKFYEHIPLIIKLLGGSSPPSIPQNTEERIRRMFFQILEPFNKYCPLERTNLISYKFILYKFFELLELDDLLDYFKLLKNRDKLYEHDQIWKKICKDLRWEYIPTRS